MNRSVLLIVCLVIHFNGTAQFRKKSRSITEEIQQSQPISSILSPDVKNYKGNELDMYIHNLYVNTYLGQELKISNFDSAIFTAAQDPYPYIYATWMNDAVIGASPKKKPHQIRLIDKIITDPKANGTVKASAYYQKNLYYRFKNNDEASLPFRAHIGSLMGWQFVGPFENISKSGVYKNFGPLEHPEPKAQFISRTNAKVSWFTPEPESKEGYTVVVYNFRTPTAVIYAQTFVNSPSEQEIYCNAGGGGAMRIWINDELIISEAAERITEMDAYTAKARLHKGVNRVLVQLSHTNKDANFIVRLTDSNFNAIPNLKGSAVYRPYVKAVKTELKPINLFAEEFFKSKIAAEPGNVVNYLLLADVFLRNAKFPAAQEVILSALKDHPDNNLLQAKLIYILLKNDNRDRMLEELAKLRQLDPNSLICMEVDIAADVQNQRLQDALQKLNTRIVSYGETAGTTEQMLNILYQQKKFQEFTNLAEKSYEKYPDNPFLSRTMFAIKREVNRDTEGAFGVYEKFLATNFEYSIILDYSRALVSQGQIQKGQGLVEKLLREVPYDTHLLGAYSDYYYNAKDFDKAELYIKKSLALAPYDAIFWARLGDIKREKGQTSEAIIAFNKSLQYDPNQYDVINKLRVLKGDKESYKIFPHTDTDQIMRADKKPPIESDAGYYVIHDEVNTIIHPWGATEKYYVYAVRITSESGINKFKESTIPYNGGAETLLIEEADVVKRSGAHIRGDRNENNVVFTNLEAGDALIVRYRIQTYTTGRFMKEYWAKYYFGNSTWVSKKLVNVFMPATESMHYAWNTGEPVKAQITNAEGFKKYSWEMKDLPPVKEEPFMPHMGDVAPVLHLSTLSNWQQIGDWYADMIHSSSEESYEVEQAFQMIFPATESSKLSEFERARRIYNFVLTNIRYSSVSFRQSAFVPQRVSETLTSRLGDCKDLSALFIALCKMSGIDGRMVLVSTSNNGKKDILLPSVEFNHCIAKITLDGKPFFIELTDRYLPFTSLPNNLVNSNVLEIPRKNEVFVSTLKLLSSETRPNDVVITKMEMTPDSNNNLSVSIRSTKTGHGSAGVRSTFSDLSKDKQLKIIEERTASRYKSGFSVTDVTFENLNSLSDSVSFKYHFVVKDEIYEIGSIRTLKIVYPDIVALASNFTANERTHAINYNAYEDIDLYITDVVVNIPEGKTVIEVPVDENISFKGMSYSLSYKQVSATQVKVFRRFNSNRNQIPKEEYAAFQMFLERIAKAESKMIAYK